MVQCTSVPLDPGFTVIARRRSCKMNGRRRASRNPGLLPPGSEPGFAADQRPVSDSGSGA